MSNGLKNLTTILSPGVVKTFMQLHLTAEDAEAFSKIVNTLDLTDSNVKSDLSKIIFAVSNEEITLADAFNIYQDDTSKFNALDNLVSDIRIDVKTASVFDYDIKVKWGDKDNSAAYQNISNIEDEFNRIYDNVFGSDKTVLGYFSSTPINIFLSINNASSEIIREKIGLFSSLLNYKESSLSTKRKEYLKVMYFNNSDDSLSNLWKYRSKLLIFLEQLNRRTIHY